MNVFTEANFQEEVLNSQLPVIVDFYADWCPPCRMIAPVIEELAGEYEGKVKVGKLNVDNSPSIAAKYGISSIPFIGFFKGGELVGSIIGAVPKEALVSKINEVF